MNKLQIMALSASILGEFSYDHPLKEQPRTPKVGRGRTKSQRAARKLKRKNQRLNRK